MKIKIIFNFILIASSFLTNGQSSPPLITNFRNNNVGLNKISSLNDAFTFSLYNTDVHKRKSGLRLNDTITFNPYNTGTIITTQYLNKGVIFSGFNGSTAPVVYEYSPSLPYGRTLISDNWYNPLRMNFVDTSNSAQYHLAKKIEFDNVVDSTILHNGEVDFMSIDVYDSMNVLIYHYLSSSPEHVVLNFTTPLAAYITIDDSANTAFVLDNILVDFGKATSLNAYETFLEKIKIFPNPISNHLIIEIASNKMTTVVLYDIYGKQIFQQVFTNRTSINTEGLADGIYFYQLRDSKGIITTGKVIKQ